MTPLDEITQIGGNFVIDDLRAINPNSEPINHSLILCFGQRIII